MPKFVTAYNWKLEPVKSFTHGDKVERSLRDETDINVIFDKYCGSGILPCRSDLTYQDNTITVKDIEAARQLLSKVDSEYKALPSKVRSEFGSIDNFVEQYNKALSGDESLLNKFYDLNVIERPKIELDTTISVQPVTPVVDVTTGQSESIQTPSASESNPTSG